MQDLAQLQQSSSTKYEISVVHTNETTESILRRNAEWNLTIAHYGCQKLSSQSSAALTGTNGDEYYGAYVQPGRAVFENIDAANYPSGGYTDNGQSVYLTTPSSIDPDNYSSAFLNNVFTNENQLLQNGFWFAGTTGYVIYTNDENDYVAQIINTISYVDGQEYWFVISDSWAWQL